MVELVVTVEDGGGIANWLTGGAVCVTGVADWKSSNSSSSTGFDSSISNPVAGCLPAAVDVVATLSSSPKSTRSTGSSLGSGFFASRFATVAGGLVPRRGKRELIGSASSSSYSSNRLLLGAVSWKSLVLPPKPPPSPNTPPL